MDRISILDDDDGWESEVDLDSASRTVSSQLERQIDDTLDSRRFFEDLEMRIDREIEDMELVLLDLGEVYDKEDIYASSQDYLEEDEMIIDLGPYEVDQTEEE